MEGEEDRGRHHVAADAGRRGRGPAARDIAWKCSFAEIERQVVRARTEHDPAEAERRRIAAAEQRCAEVHDRGISPDGIVPITAHASRADALAFDQFLTTTAATLDPGMPLDVRRSMALGMLGSGGETQRELVLYAHARPGQAMVEVEHTKTVITPEQVREWCHRAGTCVTVRPVLDLAEEMSTDADRPTPLMQEQVWVRFPALRLPRCEPPSRGCDLDHPADHGRRGQKHVLGRSARGNGDRILVSRTAATPGR